jgi:Dual-action HEIGH metallo-peptidase
MRTKLMYALLTAAILPACTERGDTIAGNNRADVDRIQLMKFRAHKAGIDTSGARIVGDSIVVFENDMASKLEPQLSTVDGVLPQAVQRADRRAMISQVRLITVDLSALQSYPAWRAGTLAAMNNWFSLPGAYVRFVEVGPGAMVTVSRQPLDNGIYAIADVNVNTSTPRVGSFLYVNSNPGPLQNANPASTTFNVNKITDVMMHELGHLIGMRHTNSWSYEPYASQAERVSGTTDSDGSSIFLNSLSPTAPPRLNFSLDDAFMIRSLWPTDAPALYAYGNQVYGTAARGAYRYEVYRVTVGGSGVAQPYLVGNINNLEDEGFAVPNTPIACPQNFQQPGLVYYEARPVFDDYGRPTPTVATASSRICM